MEKQLKFCTEQDCDEAWANGFGWGNVTGWIAGVITCLVLGYFFG